MSVILFLIILVVLIVGHEFGHLLVAKRAGMKVPEFGVGFPPRLWGKQIGSTLYSINALPFGGFVKIVGEDSDDATDADAFNKKPKLWQAATLFAGPFANVILGFVAFCIAFMIGVPAAIEAGEPRPADARVVVSAVLPTGPADPAGVEVGDKVVSIAYGETVRPINDPADITTILAEYSGALTLNVVRDEQALAFELVPQAGIIEDEPERIAIGVGSVLVGTQQYGPFTAVLRAAEATLVGLVQIATGLGTLIASAFTLSGSIQDLSGPVGIASLVGDAVGFGWGQVLALAAIISLNLAILNLLPFPALDGGRLLFLAIEAVRGRAIPSHVAGWANTVGFAILITLMLVVTWNDVARLLA